MTPQLTREQRNAIDQHQGQPVYVVDTDRCETFVLLDSTQFEKVRTMLACDVENGPWTDAKNRRRVELIDKKIAGTIAHHELVELAELQHQAEKHFDEVAPPPMQGVRQLHQQLVSRRDNEP